MPTSTFRVAALFFYPLKSAAGVPRERLEIDRFGVRDDRRWMVLDASGTPVTQRELPALARLRAAPVDGGLELEWTAPDGSVAAGESRAAPPAARRRLVRRPAVDRPRLDVTIWGDPVRLLPADPPDADWLSAHLDREVRLAWMPPDVERPVNPRYASLGERTSLTDGYPLHLIGSGSLADLNRRLDDPVGVERFRPNVFIDGPKPFDEDTWHEILVGRTRLRVVKPCPRCSVTTVDPATGDRGKEPLRTLSGYRKTERGVLFGQNALHEGSGELRVGDPVEVLSRRDAPAG